MNLLLDTNIILNIVRAGNYKSVMQFVNPDDLIIYSSVVSEAEIKSISLKNKWGAERMDVLHNLLDEINIVEVTQSYVDTYAEIDSYSQRVNPNFKSYPFATPRNMGKNDLWIAALAALLGLELITTDADFGHLHNVFFPVRKINPKDFQQFF